jgi:hypothetical protein
MMLLKLLRRIIRPATAPAELLLLMALAAVGCGGPARVNCHPVSGQVLYDGRPAAGVQVFLMPTSAPMVPQVPKNPNAVTDSDGRFRLSTYGKEDGAAEGGYQVVLFWPPPSADPEDEESNSDRLLGWYNPSRSQLTAQIKAGENQLPVIRIPPISRPPQASQGVPGRN